MANLNASKKDIRKSLKRQESNRSILSSLRTLQKKVLKLAKENSAAELKKAAQELSSKLDKAVKTSVIHQNKANRQKSAIAKYIFATS